MKAWHYTTGDNFAKIKASGVLKPSTGLAPNTQKPALWFSLNQYWEQTANKGWSDGMGNVRGEVPLDDSMGIERMNDTYEWEAVVS